MNRGSGWDRLGPDGPLATLSDDVLATRAAAGDRVALDVLLRRHQQLVYRLCRRLCLDDADALDATQEALIRVVRHIDRFDGRAAFTTWLYRVATNACLDELRRIRRLPQPVGVVGHGDDHDGGSVGELPSRDPDPVDRVADRLELDDALGVLAPEFRAAVVLRDVVGLDYAAIAAVLGIPPGTVRSRIARGRAHLADLLTRGDGRDGGDGNRHGRSARPTPQHTTIQPTPRPAAEATSEATSLVGSDSTHRPPAAPPARSPHP